MLAPFTASTTSAKQKPLYTPAYIQRQTPRTIFEPLESLRSKSEAIPKIAPDYDVAVDVTPKSDVFQIPRMKTVPVPKQIPRQVPVPRITEKTTIKPPYIPLRISRKESAKEREALTPRRKYKEWSHGFNFEVLGYSPKAAKKLGRLSE